MNALITGVTGFVGSHLADYLVRLGNIEVHGVRRPRSRDEFTRPDIVYHNGDVTDFFSMAELISKLKPNYIFHLAVQSDVHLSWQAPDTTLKGNIIGTLNVLEAVRRFSPATIVQFAGSSEEYGLVTQKECPISEKQPLRPQSPYAVSKVAADLLCQQYHQSFGVRVVITRAFNHTGPRRGHNFVTSKIARQLALIKLGKAEPVLRLGNMDAVRDFSDVRDIVRAYWLAANLCEHGKPYNIGSGKPRSVNLVYTTLEGIAKVKVVLEFTKKYGRGPAMEKFGVRDSLCFGNYLFELTHDKYFGYFPTHPSSLGDNRWVIRQQLVEAVLRRLDNSETLARVKQENKLLDAKIAHLLDEDKLLADVAISLVLSRT